MAILERTHRIEQEMLSACRVLRRCEIEKDRYGVTWYRKLLRERTDQFFAAQTEYADELDRQRDNARQERSAHDVLTNEGAPPTGLH